MRQVTVAGGNLFQLAACYFGDPTKWDRIATANSLDDVMITGVVRLAIPSAGATRAGAITVA
jgi:hypothetical protein